MIKKDLAKEIYDSTSLSMKDSEGIIDFILVKMRNALENGDDISLRGFGTFKLVTRKAKGARNMITGERVVIPEHTEIKFIPGIEMGTNIRNLKRKENE